MRRAVQSIAILVFCLSFSSGCDDIRAFLQGENTDSALPPAEQSTSTATETPSEAPYEGSRAPTRNEELPIVELDVTAGDRVIAPRPFKVTAAIADHSMQQAVYDIQRVRRIEDGKVYLEHSLDDEHSVPTALVIPVTKDPNVSQGDRILVPSAGKLAVGVVLSDGRSEYNAIIRSQRVRVRYNLVPGQYRIISPDSAVGHFAFCGSGTRKETYLIIHEIGDQLIAHSAHANTRAFDRSNCELLPLQPDVEVGDTIRAELLGNIREARVDEVDDNEQQITVSFPWRGDRREVEVNWGVFATGTAEQ
jgi:hypothetical protein